MGLSLVSSQVLRLCCCFFFFFYILMLSQHHQASCSQINGFHEHFSVADHEDQGRRSYEDQLPPVLQSQLGRGRQTVLRRPPPTAGRKLDRPRRSPPPPMPKDPNRD